MFPWSIARSAEAMLSRWAVKKLCKFLLKKKLGQFLLGDIDIDQLDVQLSQGTIQLSDLALNVDFLNHKLGSVSPLAIKEGSIGSLLVRIPWKGRGCTVEVEELEIVLVPRKQSCFPVVAESLHSSQDRECPYDSGIPSHDPMNGASKSTSGDIHEGVKTVAKIVKWFLTSFNVKLKKLIIAFDPDLEGGDKSEFHRTLVLRVSEIECGTGVSDDARVDPKVKDGNILGISRLTNFVKFEGVALELLQLDEDESKTCVPSVSSSITTPIMSGKRGGFSGNLKLSIPWKNGSLDIRRVDSDVSIDPIEMQFQPSTIKWLLEAFKLLEKDGSDRIVPEANDPNHLACRHISAPISTNSKTPAFDGYSSDLSSLAVEESCDETRLSGPHLISNWVPSLINENKNAGTEEELDFGASVDQFFECFDELRSSQSALGNSGMWNWTCSVFSAITAASSLASGSLNIPSEQQHVETNLKANFAGVSVLLSFQDEDQKFVHETRGDRTNNGSCVPYFGVECQDIFLRTQVYPREMRYEGTIKLIEICNFLSYRGDANDSGFLGVSREVNSQNLSIRQLQADVQGALPPLTSVPEEPDEATSFLSRDFPFGDKHNVVKVPLLKTSGITSWEFTRKSRLHSGSLVRSEASFEVELSPFVFWVDFSLVNAFFEMLNEISNSLEKDDSFSSKEFDRNGSSSNVKRRSSSESTVSSTESLCGTILITRARVILCFPFKKDVRNFASWDQFLALDFNSGGTVRKSRPTVDSDTQKMFSSTDTRSLHLKFGSIDVMLVNSSSKDNNVKRQRFSKEILLTVVNRAGRLSSISMVFQDGKVTGPWIAKKAKSVVTFEESKRNFNILRKDYEFASVSTVNDLEYSDSQTRNEMILSSTTFLHVSLSDTTIQLRSPQYKTVISLIDQITSGVSFKDSPESDVKKTSFPSQTSILLDCSVLEIMISPHVKENIRASIQSELPGSWHGLRLQVRKFTMLYVSNIGAICGANFFWLAHAEGKLWGSITSVDEELLLISCNNSTMKRGDGAGSNALSSRLAGCDIVHLWDPEGFQDYKSITLRCGTIIAVGGRLDWVDSISSFFSGPLVESEKADSDHSPKEDLGMSHGASFVLNLVDIGLSYEPYVKNLVSKTELVGSRSSCSNAHHEMEEENVACLLAASSLSLSNSSLSDSTEKEFKIRLQDLGLLVRVVSKKKNVNNLQKTGYVKVAHEALVEAILRINCRSGLLWELECSKSHICVETCHDTTSSLIRLAAQLQQLFVPDMEESVVHLQNRWDRVQQEQEREAVDDSARVGVNDCDSSPSTSQIHSSSPPSQSEPGLAGLMDEICEDAFQIEKHPQSFQYDSCVEFHLSSDENFLGELGACVEAPEILSHGFCVDGPVPHEGLGISQNSPEIIECYCFPDLKPFAELSVGQRLAHESPKDNLDDANRIGTRKGSSGWYGDASLRIVEDHISELRSEYDVQKVEGTRVPSMDGTESNDFIKPTGRVLLKNIDVRWRMNAGLDWKDCGENGQQSKTTVGRDTTGCLELTLAGIEFQYEAFPVGGVHVSKLSLSVQDFHLYDTSKDAPWKLVLGYYDSKDRPRKSSSKAFKLNLEAVRPDPLIPLEEYRLRIAILPMRLHLHQSQLDFLIGFFGAKNVSLDQPPGCQQDSDCPKLAPMMTNNNLARLNIVDEALLPFFQSFDIWPIIVRVDYSPCRVDLAALRGGKYVELVNLVPWKGVELKLMHVHGVGVYGWGSVGEMIVGEWLEDISQNQVHKILRGLPPIRSVVALGAGASKLVSLPVKSYKKDKRVLKGMQRGITAFLRSISVEAVGLGVHLAAGAHDILLQAEYMVTNSAPSVPRSKSLPSRTQTNFRSNQPKDAQQGIQQAYESLSSGLEKSASALVQTPLKKYQRGAGAGSALAAAVRAVPAAAIAPASACAGAVHYALLGFRNSLDPERKKESMEKYLGPTPPQPWEQN